MVISNEIFLTINFVHLLKKIQRFANSCILNHVIQFKNFKFKVFKMFDTN